MALKGFGQRKEVLPVRASMAVPPHADGQLATGEQQKRCITRFRLPRNLAMDMPHLPRNTLEIDPQDLRPYPQSLRRITRCAHEVGPASAGRKV